MSCKGAKYFTNEYPNMKPFTVEIEVFKNGYHVRYVCPKSNRMVDFITKDFSEIKDHIDFLQELQQN